MPFFGGTFYAHEARGESKKSTPDVLPPLLMCTKKKRGKKNRCTDVAVISIRTFSSDPLEHCDRGCV